MNSQSVDLIYLDPPFNSKRTYSAPIGTKAAGSSFKDMWTWEDVNEAYLDKLVSNYPMLVDFIKSIQQTHSKAMMAYVTYMTQRLIELHRILKDTGSLYLHCDPTASHYLKIVLDRIFGKDNFRNEIVWHYYNGSNSAHSRFGRKHDTIFFYSKVEKNSFFNWDISRIPYEEGSIYATGTTYGKKGYIKGNPKGKLMHDVWRIPSINNMAKERTGYPTQKPLALLYRIIKASSNEGDIVFDPFCGCATACVAAQQLGRHWIGIDIEEQAAPILVQRLSDDAGLFKNFIHRKDVPQRSDIAPEPINQTIKERLFAEQKGACNACAIELNIQNFEVDHIIPKSKGGGDYYENYQLLCGNCNRIKGNRPMEYLRIKIAQRDKLLKEQITFG
ncbi:methyltransferase [Elysia marginata]|uniref:Methyltransferase n=1 Tax=Elysia marginata TaxID=1093978 RepID=A0AAV4FR91_9GAST|nr:methyltransferase [Elysia marginata]